MGERPTVAGVLREATLRLEAVSDTARLDAELLMAEALQVTRSELLLRHMDGPVPEGFAEMVERRMRHEPVAYIAERQEFYGLDLIVTPDVLIPRTDSETLIEVAREAFCESAPSRILDLGTGSGALLLAALSVWPKAEGCGLDRSVEALLVAIRNAQRHAGTPIGIVGSYPIDSPPARTGSGFARFIQRDWHSAGWANDLGKFDLILANPPYVEDRAELPASVREYEPGGALFAGPEGLDDYRVLVPQLPGLLAEGGIACLEIGASQAAAVTQISEAAGFSVEIARDLAGRARVAILRLGLGKGGEND